MADEETPWYSYFLPVLLAIGVIIASGMVAFTYFIYRHNLLVLKLLQRQEEERRQAAKQRSQKTCRRETVSSGKSEKSEKTKKKRKTSVSEKKNKKTVRSLPKSVPKSEEEKKCGRTPPNTPMKESREEGAHSRVQSVELELKPMNLGYPYTLDLRVLVKKLAPFLEDFGNHPEQFDVSRNVIPGFIYNYLPRFAPEDPCDVETLWSDFARILWPGLTIWQHPRFFGYFPCGRSTPDTLAEMIISGLGVPASEWIGCPPMAELEVAMINWSGRALGLPEEMLFHGNTETSPGGGCLTESASESIFLAVLAARTRKIDQVFKEKGEVAEGEHAFFAANRKKLNQHAVAGKLVVYSSKEAHSSIEKACRMALVRYRPLMGDPNLEYSLTGKTFEQALVEDMGKGLIPCMVHVTLGTTSSCAFDKLNEIGPIAQKYGIWVHVDSAYAGSTWIDPKNRTTQEGIEWVDSIDINLHKMLRHSNSLSLLFTRRQPVFRAAFVTQNPRKGTPVGYNTCEWGLHDTRRQKALKMWLVFRLKGTDGLREYVNRICDMAAYLRNLMLPHPNIRMFGELKPAFFSFQYFENGMSEEEINYHTDKLRLFMNETGQVLVTNSSVQGKTIMRIAVGFDKICKEDMDTTWEILKRFLEIYKEKKDDPGLMKFPPSALKK